MPIVERREIVDKNQWQEWRKHDVTASTIGALFNCHPYVSALRLHVEKRGVEFSNTENSAMRRGRWLEPAVAAAVRELRPEWAIRPAGVYLSDPETRIGATPDFFIDGDPRGAGVLQCKTIAPSIYHTAWDDGREPPFWITLQALTESMLADAAFGVIAGLVVDAFDMDVVILEVPRHPAAESKIIEAVRQFWIDVAAGREPQPDFARDTEVIKQLTAKETSGKVFDATGNNELPILLAERAELMTAIKQNDERCTEIENEIKLMLGDAEKLSGLPGWSVTYRTVSRQAYNVPAKASRQLRILDKRKEPA